MFTVTAALLTVRANDGGNCEFATEAEAREFVEKVYDRYPSQGYGTSCVINGTVVGWRVYNAD